MSTISTSVLDVTISPEAIARNLVSALDEGRIDSAVELFDRDFVLRDYALDLEFSDKADLTDFFSKRQELFPEVHYHLQSLQIMGSTVILRWMLEGFAPAATYGQRKFKFRVMANGVSIVECSSGKITAWSDYYDGLGAMRRSLLTYFKRID